MAPNCWLQLGKLHSMLSSLPSVFLRTAVALENDAGKALPISSFQVLGGSVPASV